MNWIELDFFIIQPPCLEPLPSKAPAASLRGMAARAREDAGEGPLKNDGGKNACRNAHAFVKRWGLSWNIPFSYLDHIDDAGNLIKIPYVSPKSFLEFLLKKAPQLVFGGYTDLEAGQNNLDAFWKTYLKVHPSHVMSEPHPERSTANSFAVCLHGDEGRGLKKGNTCVISLETTLGLDLAAGDFDRGNQPCGCCLEEPYAKRFRLNSGQALPRHGMNICETQELNLKQNSFLTKFVLAVLPNKYYKKTDVLERLLDVLVDDLTALFNHGFHSRERQWFVGLVGLKGDLRWYEKIAKLNRCFNKQLKSGACMCHECMAGSPALPFENADHVPPWSGSLYAERPWDTTDPPSISRLPFDGDTANPKAEMMLRRDIFHNAKVGILRDFCGGAVLLLCHLRYFHDTTPGVSNKRDLLLERAHQHFLLFCRTMGKSPALHSFTLQFFNSPNSSSFAWVNAKASDVMLMVSWICVLAAGFCNDPIKQDHSDILKTLLECASNAKTFLQIIYNHKLWLTRHCAATLYQEVHGFLVNYNRLAFLSMYQEHYTAFALKSKFHLVCHMKFEIWSLLVAQPQIDFIPNPGMFACDMCEDVVGKLSRLSRRVSPQIPSQRTLELYFMKAHAIYQRFITQKRLAKKQ